LLGKPKNNATEKRNAVAALYETHFERVTRYIAARIGNVNEAEDLASEVFVRALRTCEQFEDTGAPMEAWIFKIAHNIVIDHYRKTGRRPASVPLDNAFSLSSDEDPTRNIEYKQEVQRLNQAMLELSDSQREVLALRFVAELTSEQVAETVNAQ